MVCHFNCRYTNGSRFSAWKKEMTSAGTEAIAKFSISTAVNSYKLVWTNKTALTITEDNIFVNCCYN